MRCVLKSIDQLELHAKYPVHLYYEFFRDTYYNIFIQLQTKCKQRVYKDCIMISRYIDIFLFLIINAEAIPAQICSKIWKYPCDLYHGTCTKQLHRNMPTFDDAQSNNAIQDFFQCLNTSRKITRSSREVQQGAKKPNPQT